MSLIEPDDVTRPLPTAQWEIPHRDGNGGTFVRRANGKVVVVQKPPNLPSVEVRLGLARARCLIDALTAAIEWTAADEPPEPELPVMGAPSD